MKAEVIHADCLEAMRHLPDGSIDACITDPPYGTTACAWDAPIPFAPMWAQLKRVVKRHGAIVLFGSQPFTSALVMSNPTAYKHRWIWSKGLAGNFAVTAYMPLSVDEDVLVFGFERINYYPQMRTGVKRTKGSLACQTSGAGFGGLKPFESVNDQYHPTSILEFPNTDRANSYHPSQKPVELMRYLVRTYTNAGDTILDFTCGSGSTGVACVIEGRNFIGIENDTQYFAIAEARIKRAQGIAVDIPRPIRQDKVLPLFQSEAVA